MSNSSSSSSSAHTLGSPNRNGTDAATSNGIVSSANDVNINSTTGESVMRPQDALAQTGEYSNRDSHAPYGGSSTYLHTTTTPSSGAAAQGETPPACKDVAGDSAPLTPAVKRTDTIQDVAGENAKVNDSSDVYPVVRPARKKSVIQRKVQYIPVTDQVNMDRLDVHEDAVMRQFSESAKPKRNDIVSTNREKLLNLVDGLHNETHGDTAKEVRIVDDGASLDMYNFVIGESKKDNSSYDRQASYALLESARSKSKRTATSRSTSSSSDSSGSTTTTSSSSSSKSSRRKSSALQTNDPVPQFEVEKRRTKKDSTVSSKVPGNEYDKTYGDVEKKGKVTFAELPSSDEDEGGDEKDFARPTAQIYECLSEENLSDDTVSFRAYWESLHSPTLYRAILLALRTVIFAVVPAFVLVTHPNTKDWFKGGIIVAVGAAMSVRQILGMQIMVVIVGLQAATFLMPFGVIMNAVGAKNNAAAWWCGVLFGPFIVGLFGQLGCKRLMMMFIVVVMQTEHIPGGTEITFPCYFGRDVIFGCLFALLAGCLPYPTRATVRADECFYAASKLLGLITGNITKSFWAPVNIDAKASLSQVPFGKVSSLLDTCKQMIAMATYEPFERSLTNQLRTERVEGIHKMMVPLHCAYGAALKRIENLGMKQFDRRGRLGRHLENRLRPPAEELSREIIKSLETFGKVHKPEEVAKVDTIDLEEAARVVSDITLQFRRDLLYYRGATSGEVNMVLTLCVFHESLVQIAEELKKVKESMINFDPTKYKSTWQRAKEFFFLEYWNSFWEELPRRLTLATPYDVRIWKDSVKYSLAFTVACAFTLRVDPGHIYFFGMAILIRLAQQTVSETLQIGIMRIFGLCIGASLSYITIHHTHRYVEEVLLTMTFVFVALCCSSNPTLTNGAQYTMIICMTGLSLAGDPAMLMTRVSDNVFSFISYFLICTFVFPVDPTRLLWNTRTKIFKSMNSVMQLSVAMVSSPIARDENQIQELLTKTQTLLTGQHALMRQYADLMTKSETEPMLRGGDYPTEATRKLLTYFSYITAIQELLLSAIRTLYRDRSSDPVNEVSAIFLDAMDVYRPFMEDMGRIVYAITQDFIYCTERSTTWSVEGLLHSLWKANSAIKGLHVLIGNIQKNYMAALMELSPEEKANVNKYMSSSFVSDRLTLGAANAALAEHQSGTVPPPNNNNNNNKSTASRKPKVSPSGEDDSFPGDGDPWEESHILADSFLMTPGAMWNIQDTKGFGTLATASELFLKSMSAVFQPMLRIHEFEKSRHPVPGHL